MGFCRRCGDIVNGPRCKCGGTPVAAVVQWNQTGNGEEQQDKWSQTYTKERLTPRPPSRGPFEPTRADTSPTPAPNRRYPRPKSATISSPVLGDRVSAHIANFTNRPTSPLKSSSHADNVPAPLASDVLVSPHTSELAKAYGTRLQPKETLATFTCHVCSTPFPPDATIYPDPSAPSLAADAGRFLCKPCFITHGGSRGDCHACQRPVLILKREGGFVEASGRVYHKTCFRCEGCYKNIGENPMVDLLGRPSCVDCFDSCLNRKDGQQKTAVPQTPEPQKKATLGGMIGGKSRESSPALEELESRLGILRNRETTSPSMSRSRVNSDARPGDNSPVPRRYTRLATPEPQTRSPSRGRESLSSSSRPNENAIEEMKRRFLRTSLTSPDTTPVKAKPSTPETPPSRIPKPHRGVTSPNLRFEEPETTTTTGLALSTSPPISTEPKYSLSPRQSLEYKPALSSSAMDSDRFPRTPDLMSDLSDTQSSGVKTPPTSSPSSRYTPRTRTTSFASKTTDHTPTKPKMNDVTTPTKPFHSKRSLENLRIPAPLSPESKCARCGIHLFTTNGGKFVTVPEEPSALRSAPKVYHSDCFRCHVCDGMFAAGDQGQAVFVRTEGGPCHVDCAPVERVKTRPFSSPPPARTNIYSSSSASSSAASSIGTESSATNGRYERSPFAAPASVTAFPRFGSPNSCPGCFKAVSPMERGVVPGPQGTRWHATCLVCGGQAAKRRSGRREEGKPGCGKKLDSAAKSDGEGGVWCRECLLLLPGSTRTPSTAGRSPLIGNNTGTGSFWSTRSATAPLPAERPVSRQFTGATTIARQQTGLGFVPSPSSDPAVLSQLTGGGLSPTRQLGMTGLSKQVTGGAPAPVRTHTTGGTGIKSHFTGGSVVRTNITGGTASIGRPKSAAGFRSAKSVDEGRGMFLVRQMTGGQSTFGL